MKELRRRASAHGLLTRYVDAAGNEIEAKDGPLEAVLNRVAEDRRRHRARQSLPPVLVAWDGEPLSISTDEVVSEVVLDLEDGSPGFVTAAPGRRLDLDRLPHGYHRLSAVVGGRRETTTVIAAPRRAYGSDETTRSWGLFAPVYAMDRGKLADLADLVSLVATYGGSFAGTLPLLPTCDADPSPSPYSPLSRLFWNERFVDGDALADAPSAAQEPPSPALAEYARFRARRDGDDARFDHYVRAQRAASRELATLVAKAENLGVGLYLDLPLGVHRDGFDVARSPELFAVGTDVGAPPDALFEGGQNWSFPPILPEASRFRGHDYFRRAVQHHMRYAALLRVDHVMGLHRLFWIPPGVAARDGIYVTYPEDELYAVLTLESHRARSIVIGENLGTVPPEVDERLERHGFLGLFVLQFEIDSNGPGAHVLACLDTHDTPTFAGFCRNQPEAVRRFDARLRLEEPSEMERLEAWLQWLLRSDARYVSVTLEDLWLEEDPQNVPGTTTEHANWTRKLRYSLKALPTEVEALLSRLKRDARA